MGRIAPGLVSKRIGVINVMLICVSAVMALLFGLLGVKSLASVAVFAVLYGFFTGACKCFLSSELHVRVALTFFLRSVNDEPNAGGLV